MLGASHKRLLPSAGSQRSTERLLTAIARVMAQVIMLGAHVGVLKSTLVLLAVFLAHGVEFRALGSIHQHHRAAVEREVEEDVAPAAGADAGYGEPQGEPR